MPNTQFRLKHNLDRIYHLFDKLISSHSLSTVWSSTELVNAINKSLPRPQKVTTRQLPFIIKYKKRWRPYTYHGDNPTSYMFAPSLWQQKANRKQKTNQK